MLIIYRLLINIIFLFSPIIIIYRLFQKKESFTRFKEKFCLFTKKRKKGQLIWFHGASVGELQSIIPLIEKFEKNKKINQILVTSNTLSSSNIIEKIKLKKTIHQFYPIDTFFLSKKFLKYWKPSKVFFIDSEIWPNMMINLKDSKIPSILLNGRITKKTFNRWNLFSNFQKRIFGNFSLCLSANNETKKYLKKLGAKKVEFFGNLKFSQSENIKLIINKDLTNFLKEKKIWCASSTHKDEEIFCGLVHLELKKKYKNLCTIIIPRHIDRIHKIRNELMKLGLNVHNHEPKMKIKSNTDIYLVNAYGKTKSFYKLTNNVFLGGSLIKHGGQNPLEAARYGCNILHGPYVSNFKDIYTFLKKNKMSQKINSKNQIVLNLIRLFNKPNKINKVQSKLNKIGNEILNNTYNKINTN